MRPRLIAGNWKMYKTVSEAREFMQSFLKVFQAEPGVEVVVAPPFIALSTVFQASHNTSIQLAAQNVYTKDEGAYTGEISAPMLKDLGCTYVIIGHSERRQHFQESNELINHKIHAALLHGLEPILCVGELWEEREAGHTETVITHQIFTGLEGVSSQQMKTLTIAYEPIWAIGTGQAATVDQAEEVHAHIRTSIANKWGLQQDELRVVYGGSVKPENAGFLFQSHEINGALVGNACLHPDSFAKIISLAT